MNKRGKVTPSNQSPNLSSRTRSPRGRRPSGRTSRWPCKDHLRGTCKNSFCEKWHPPECLFHKTKSGCRFFGKSARLHIEKLMNNRQQGPKKNDDKSAVAVLKKRNWQERDSVTDWRNSIRVVIKSWDKIHLNVNHLMHGNWVLYFRT